MKFLIILIVCLNTLFSTEKIILGNIELGQGLDTIPEWKIDAAFTLISDFSNSFSYVNNKEKGKYLDSISADKKLTIKQLARKMDAQRVAIIRLNRMENLFGLSITLVSTVDSIPNISGTGFENLNFKEIETGKSVFDIAITKALQRALAEAYKNPNLFKMAPPEYKTYPLERLAIGGLEFEDEKKFVKWQIFQDKTINSYDIVETMWKAANDSKKYITIDIPTRDTIYARFNMYGIENYDAPTPFEIDALSKLNINRYITGKFSRIGDGALIKIHLCEINSKGLTILKTEEAILEEDRIIELRKIVEKTTRALLDKK